MNKYIWLLLFLLLPLSVFAENSDTESPRFKAVESYLLDKEDYPELFKDNPYRLKVTGLAIGDLDDDGQDEVVLQMKPHYRQSPTIVIFRVDDDMKVTRVIEGLAPGPLLPISDEYLDSHTLGMAVDMEISQNDGEMIKTKKPMIDILLKNFGGVVEYKNWFHTDARSGRKMYIDMRHLDVPENKLSCADFEYSTVKLISIVKKNGVNGNLLSAYVDDKLYVYKINKFKDNGLMEKSLEILMAK